MHVGGWKYSCIQSDTRH